MVKTDSSIRRQIDDDPQGSDWSLVSPSLGGQKGRVPKFLPSIPFCIRIRVPKIGDSSAKGLFEMNDEVNVDFKLETKNCYARGRLEQNDPGYLVCIRLPRGLDRDGEE